mgnify:CR=1 FL=1
MNDSIVIRGEGNKSEFVTFNFDKFLRPTKIYYSDRTAEYKQKKSKSEKYESPLSPIKSDEKYGLCYNGEITLPAQFDEVAFCLNNFAVVCVNDKWGMLLYDKALKYKLIMHNGKDIAFRHKDVTTTINAANKDYAVVTLYSGTFTGVNDFVKADEDAVIYLRSINGQSDGILGFNMYAYCLNNPVIMIDRSGSLAGVDDLAFLTFVIKATIITNTIF